MVNEHREASRRRCIGRIMSVDEALDAGEHPDVVAHGLPERPPHLVAVMHPGGRPHGDAWHAFAEWVTQTAKWCGRTLFLAETEDHWLYVTVGPMDTGGRDIYLAQVEPNGEWTLLGTS